MGDEDDGSPPREDELVPILNNLHQKLARSSFVSVDEPGVDEPGVDGINVNEDENDDPIFNSMLSQEETKTTSPQIIKSKSEDQIRKQKTTINIHQSNTGNQNKTNI